MKRVLITGANSYIGVSFEKYVTEKYSAELSIDTIDMTDASWRQKDFSSYDIVYHVAGIAHADIGNVNLIPVSSMLPPDAQEIPLPKLEPGEMTNCVLSHQYSDVPGDTISAVIAYAQAEEMGCVIETKGINKTKQELTDEAKFMAEYMIEKRQLEIINYKQIIQTHTVEEKASVVAALIYHNPRRH